MDKQESIHQAREALETLREIGDKIEGALADADDYWSWPTFFKDKMGDLMPVKEQGQQAVDQLRDAVESLREINEDPDREPLFEEIDDRKESISRVVDEIKDKADLKTLALNGEELANLLEELLDRFRSTSESVEKLLEAMEED